MEIASAKEVATREDEGQAIEIRDANGEIATENGKPVTITVVGTYSAVYRRAIDSQRNRMVKLRKTQLTGDALLNNQLELVASCIIAWEGFTNAGAPFPCTKENAVLLLTQAPWIREQVEEAMNDHESFFKRPSVT